jgi:hypothetical protein
MSEEIRADQEIARLVRRVETNVPPALDGRIRAVAAHHVSGRSWTRRFWYLALIPSAAAAILAAVLIRPALYPTADPPLSEIRTEFELVDKNIKIVFIQKPDFHLYEEDINE